mmetsp:Transcript_17575/g.57631  ORF Transcript_17575/g.57631 Transcript_17575/m.57631 type:complete len:227 (+) Transcript_17575:351-1031(+)
MRPTVAPSTGTWRAKPSTTAYTRGSSRRGSTSCQRRGCSCSTTRTLWPTRRRRGGGRTTSCTTFLARAKSTWAPTSSAQTSGRGAISDCRLSAPHADSSRRPTTSWCSCSTRRGRGTRPSLLSATMMRSQPGVATPSSALQMRPRCHGPALWRWPEDGSRPTTSSRQRIAESDDKHRERRERERERREERERDRESSWGLPRAIDRTAESWRLRIPPLPAAGLRAR